MSARREVGNDTCATNESARKALHRLVSQVKLDNINLPINPAGNPPNSRAMSLAIANYQLGLASFCASVLGGSAEEHTEGDGENDQVALSSIGEICKLTEAWIKMCGSAETMPVSEKDFSKWLAGATEAKVNIKKISARWSNEVSDDLGRVVDNAGFTEPMNKNAVKRCNHGLAVAGWLIGCVSKIAAAASKN